MMQRRYIFIGVITFLLFFLVSGGFGSESDRRNLRGLPGLLVFVEELKPNIMRDGLTDTQLLTDVELRLRKAGIRVLSEQEMRETPGMPHLYIHVDSIGSHDGYAFSISVQMQEGSFLARNSLPVLATTWEKNRMGTVPKRDLMYIRLIVGDQVDQFINDYLVANPK